MAVREKKNYGPTGLAKVSILKTGVRVQFKDGDVYDIPGSAPEYVSNGEFVITLSADKTKILGVKPPAGQYTFRFKRWGNRTVGRTQTTEGLPTNKVQPARVGTKKDGTTFPIAAQLVCTAEFEIVGGPFDGLSIQTNVPYSFSEPATGNMTDFYDTKAHIETLNTLFVCTTGHSLETIDIPFSSEPPQLLLRFEKFMGENEKLFLGNTTETGFLDMKSLSPLPEQYYPKVKKTVKKAPAKKKVKK